MKYKILNKLKKKDIFQRLLKVRNIEDNIQSFINPSREDYRHDPFLLKNMKKSVEKIIKTIKQNGKIMIFGDYDVDGITSSFLLYSFFTEHINYKNISVMFPDRIKDGYGLKNKHIDIMKGKGIDLIITVDNGITSIEEAKYSKKCGIDLIITDHHEVVNNNIPDAFAVINPKISEKYPFPNLCGAGVAFKLLSAMLDKGKFSVEQKKTIFSLYLPIVSIATVADIVPLVDENRLIVAKGLEQISNRQNLLPSLSGFLDFLNLKKVNTFHIGFVIGPRINAGGRIASPYDSFYSLLFSGKKQKEKLTILDEINTERRSMQEKAIKTATKEIDSTKKIIFVANKSFHEGVVGIVAGRLTEKYYKPSIVLKINKKEGIAVGSLRGPDYFDVIKMISSAQDLLERFGGHKQAGGLSVKLENLEKLQEELENYCDKKIKDKDLERVKSIDCYLFEEERNENNLNQIEKLGPYGEGNPEPIFCLQNCEVLSCDKIGKKGKGHIKMKIKFGENKIDAMFWSEGDKLEEYTKCHTNEKKTFYGKVKKSDFDDSWFLDCVGIE